ncbi:hypothetical protein ACFW1P_24615 [Paenibacillus sp. NPDC058910]|uniref:hypothetical protein n=1 Tax=unclassified Paenibacillus TaxID=185978 RepID=UPI003685EB21
MIVWTFELAERYGTKQVTFNAFHPGSQLNTKMVQQSGFEPFGNVQSGADSIFHLAISSEVDGTNGNYFNEKQPDQAKEQANDRDFRLKLWEASETLIRKIVTMSK